MEQSLYYQACVKKKDCWFFVAILRSFEHLAFDRTIDKRESRLEFFVPVNLRGTFEEVMAWFEKKGNHF